jgi:hypothetical protein
MGFVSRDMAYSNLKVNQVASLRNVVSCNNHQQSAATELTNNRTGFTCTVPATTYGKLDTLASGTVFVLTNSTTSSVAEAGGVNNGRLQFISSGSYKVSVYGELRQTNSQESAHNIWICCSPSSIVPTSTSNNQMGVLVPVYTESDPYICAGSMTFTLDVNAGDTYDFFILSDSTAYDVRFDDFIVSIVSV